MILKASQRGFGRELARHLMRLDENDHVTLHELRGFSSETLDGAFKEAEAVSLGTKCRQPLFSLSLNPPEQAHVTDILFEDAISRVEERLGLEGQPRAIVFHEKNGRRHAHCVWSRIDAETMTAKHLPFFKDKLSRLSRELYLEHDWPMPKGIAEKGARKADNFTLAEWQQAKRHGVDPRDLKQSAQRCWKSADSLKAFDKALQENGFFLAKGDRRGLVMMDYNGEVYSLPRMLGIKTKEVRERLGEGDTLPNVEETRRIIGERMTPALRRHIDEARTRFEQKQSRLDERKSEMVGSQRDDRETLKEHQQQEWQQAAQTRTMRLPVGWRAIWWRITGKYQHIKRDNERDAQEMKERHAAEQKTLFESQHNERTLLEKEIKSMRKDQAFLLAELRRDVGRYMLFSQGDGHSHHTPTLEKVRTQHYDLSR